MPTPDTPAEAPAEAAVEAPPQARPWDRQPGETPHQFQAFVRYRDQPGAEGQPRSQRRLAQHLGRSLTLIRRWAAANDWVDRATKWDEHVDSVRKQAVLDAAREGAVRLQQTGITGAMAAAPTLLARLRTPPGEKGSMTDAARVAAQNSFVRMWSLATSANVAAAQAPGDNAEARQSYDEALAQLRQALRWSDNPDA